jgi:hypothetical protein
MPVYPVEDMPPYKLFLIESDREEDMQLGLTEGAALSEALKLAQVLNRRFAVADKNELLECLACIQRELVQSLRTMARTGEPAFICWLHFSCHGNENGLSLSGGDFLSWTELRNALVGFFFFPGYGSSSPLVLISLSACRGVFAGKIMFADPPPFGCSVLVGPNRDVVWADALTAFVSFYHLTLIKRLTADEAVAGMNHAAGLDGVFQCEHAVRRSGGSE